MKRSKPAPVSDLLFDLPLEPTSPAPRQMTPTEDLSESGDQTQLALENAARASVEEAIESATSAIGENQSSAAPLSARFLASILDFGALAAVFVLGLFAAWRLGIEPALSLWPPLVLFLASFSFLYTVVPLAFWGRTPGMAYTGIVSRNNDGLPLTIAQTVFRWLGIWITYVAIGLPALVAMSGVSISDLLSRSRVFVAPRQILL